MHRVRGVVQPFAILDLLVVTDEKDAKPVRPCDPSDRVRALQHGIPESIVFVYPFVWGEFSSCPATKKTYCFFGLTSWIIWHIAVCKKAATIVKTNNPTFILKLWVDREKTRYIADLSNHRPAEETSNLHYVSELDFVARAKVEKSRAGKIWHLTSHPKYPVQFDNQPRNCLRSGSLARPSQTPRLPTDGGLNIDLQLEAKA